jgi:hypothetical protein
MIQPAVIAAAPARFDHHVFLEAPHGTELARYGSPGQARQHHATAREMREPADTKLGAAQQGP